MNHACATVIRIVPALDQPLFFQTVNGGADGAAGQPDFGTDHVYRQRAFVQQNLQDAEIRKPQPHRPDVLVGIGCERVVGFP